ncbi:MAG: toll/interleukin-1 receptor domain-containing protein [Desulfobacteraceae bacterium]|nr:toll/interleukin-1 receptor domain-containing protein [Desulfobacteraceae bacterium]
MSVFISYSSQDKEFVRRLAHDLNSRGNWVWFGSGKRSCHDSNSASENDSNFSGL